MSNAKTVRMIDSHMAEICTEEEFEKNMDWLTSNPSVKSPFITIVDNKTDDTRNIIRVDMATVEEIINTCKATFSQIIHIAKKMGLNIYPVEATDEYFSHVVSFLSQVRTLHAEKQLDDGSYDFYVYYLSYLIREYSKLNPQVEDWFGENNVCIITINKDDTIIREFMRVVDTASQVKN